MDTTEQAAATKRLDDAADAAIREPISGVWINQTPVPTKRVWIFRTSHGDFTVIEEPGNSRKCFIHFMMTVYESVPLNLEEAKQQCVELLIPQIEEIVSECRKLAEDRKRT